MDKDQITREERESEMIEGGGCIDDVRSAIILTAVGIQKTKELKLTTILFYITFSNNDLNTRGVFVG